MIESIDVVDVTIGCQSGLWFFWETEYPDDMVIGPFDTEGACRDGVEDFYTHNNPFATGQTSYVITRVRSRS